MNRPSTEASIAQQITTLSRQVEDAIAALERGQITDLTDMQKKTEHLCRDINRTGNTNPALVVACKGAMADLITRLDVLAEGLEDFRKGKS